MEKNTSFLSLVYREYCLTKKSAFGNIFTCVMVYGICIMFTLSAKFGNISKISENSDMAAMKKLLIPTVRMMGIYFSFMLLMIAADAAASDLKNKTWALYRKSLPVKPLRLALARTAWQALMFLASAAGSFVYMGVDSLISGNGISRGDIGVMSALAVLCVLLVVSMTVCFEFTRSYDQGGLMAMGIIIVAAAAFIIPHKVKFDLGNQSLEELQEMFGKLAGLAPVFFAAAALLFVMETALLTWIYKRREK